MIYFLRKPDGSAIKIGTTIRLAQRLKNLAKEHGEGLEVLAVIDGSFAEEKALHGRFSHLRTVGEWFEPGDDLMGFIVSDGKPWDREDDASVPTISVRIEEDAYEVVRQVATMTGESVIIALSRLARDGGKIELLANAKRVVERLEGEVKPKARPKARKGSE